MAPRGSRTCVPGHCSLTTEIKHGSRRSCSPETDPGAARLPDHGPWYLLESRGQGGSWPGTPRDSMVFTPSMLPKLAFRSNFRLPLYCLYTLSFPTALVNAAVQ